MSQHSNNRKSGNQELISKHERNASQGKIDEDSASSAEQILREMQDEISPEATPLWQFVNDNAPKIATIVISLVILIASYAFYQGHQESSLESARINLSIIISNPDDVKRLAALEAYKNEAPAEFSIAIELEIAQAALRLGDLIKAQSAFSYVKNEEANSPLGINATINLGDILARQGEAQKAIDMYESILEQVPSQFRLTLYVNIADVAASANMKEKAISAYKNALNALPKENMNPQEIEYFNARIMQLS